MTFKNILIGFQIICNKQIMKKRKERRKICHITVEMPNPIPVILYFSSSTVLEVSSILLMSLVKSKKKKIQRLYF